MDDFNIRVPSQYPSLAYSYSPSYQMPAISQYTPQYTPQYVPSRSYEPYQSPYAIQSRQYDEPYQPPYISQIRDRYYDGSSRSSRQYGDRNYDYYDQPRAVTPPSAYPTGGRRFQEPSSRSVNPPSMLSELSAYSEQNAYYDRPALREPFNAPRPFSQRPSQPPQRTPVDAYNVPSRMSANRRPEKNSFLSGLMPRSRELNGYYEPNQNYQYNQKDNALKQLTDGFASTTSQLFSGIPSMGSTYQPTSIPDSVMMPRRGGRAPKPIVTTTARTSLPPERSLMSELVNNPNLANAIVDNPMMNGGYNTQGSVNRDNSYSSQRSQGAGFPSMSPSYGQSTQEGYQQRRIPSNNDGYNRGQQNFSFDNNSMRNNVINSGGFDNRSNGNMMQSNSFQGYNGNNQGNMGENNMNQGNGGSFQMNNNVNGNYIENKKQNSGSGGLGNMMSSIVNMFGMGNDESGSGSSFQNTDIGERSSSNTMTSNVAMGFSGGGATSGSFSSFGKSSGGFGGGLGSKGATSGASSSFGKSSGGFGGGLGGGAATGTSSFGKSSGGFGGGLGGGGLGSKGAATAGNSSFGGFGKNSGGFKSSSGMFKSS